MNNFGIKLKELRLKKGESQKDLADVLNISFQSVSKWEQGIHYPDVFMIEQIAKHYDVDYNYLFNKEDDNKLQIETFILETSVNENNAITVWTDFEYKNSIAPKAVLDETRHCAGNRFLMTHPGPKRYLIIAVNENHQICFMSHHKDNNIPICGPQGEFYSQTNGMGRNNPCLIIQDSYKYKFNGERTNGHEKDFEFVIPKNGFLINIPYYSIETKELLMFLTRKSLHKVIDRTLSGSYIYRNETLFKGSLCADELNSISVYLNDSKVLFEKVKSQENDETKYENLKEVIEELEDRIYALELRIEEMEEIGSRLDDLEDRIDDIDNLD